MSRLFDGVTQYDSLATSLVGSGTYPFTFGFIWHGVTTPSVIAPQIMISFQDATLNNALSVFTDGGLIAYNTSIGGVLGTPVTGSIPLVPFHVYHVMIVAASATNITMYLDGVPIATNTTSLVLGSLSQTSVGAALSSGIPFDFFCGAIDELAVWNVALTAPEVWWVGKRKRSALGVRLKSLQYLYMFGPLLDRNTIGAPTSFTQVGGPIPNHFLYPPAATRQVVAGNMIARRRVSGVFFKAPATAPVNTRALTVENQRAITQRGKPESGLIVVLGGTAASAVTVDIQATPRSITVENGIRYLTRTPGGYFTSIVTIYPNDVAPGFDNFDGWPPAPPPFIQQWINVGLISAETSYANYNPSPDIIYSSFRRRPHFDGPNEFFQSVQGLPFQAQTRNVIVTSLVIVPVTPVDVLTLRRPRQSQAIFAADETYAPQKGLPTIVLNPQIGPTPPVPPPPFLGAGPILGVFSGASILGVFT